MKIPLQDWYDAWRAVHAETTLIYVSKDSHGPYLPQVHFVRDELANLVWAGAPRRDRSCVNVIGEHTSKSVRLPVYSLERSDLGLRIVLRYNYYDWKLSVISNDRPIKSDLFPFLFHTTPPIAPDYTGNELAPCYFEGLPKELVFGYHADNAGCWSASLEERALWTTVFECMRSLGALTPHIWHTRESHRALLDAEQQP